MLDASALKAELEAERARLITDLKTIAWQNKDTGDWEALPDSTELSEADENSEADGVEEWNERRATVAALETTYRDTERALEKLALGTYGTCEVCTAKIEPERLEALPTARTCMEHFDEEETLSL